MTDKQQTIAIVAAILVYVVLGFFLAEYIAGGAYFLACKTMPADITLDTWGQYWHWYSDDPVQRKRLEFAAGFAGILVYLVPLIVISALRNGRRSLHGDARFARSSEVRRAGLYNEKGIIVGKYSGQYLMLAGQQFVLLAAPTRSGKGAAIVVPNLLNYSGSVVVLDIKLENFKLTSGFRAAHGQKVFLFNPFAEDGKTHRWNIFDGISKNHDFRIGDILAIGQALYPTDGSVRDPFWNDQARNLFLGLTLYLLDTPKLPCTFGELLRQASGKGQPIKDYVKGIMAKRSNGDDALCDECLDALNRFCSISDNTLSNILASFNAPLTIFANPLVDAATSATDFDVTMVRKELMSIYIGIQPNRLADASLLINLFFSQLINLNTKELPAENPALKHQCLLILDEFTAIGKVGIIAKSVAFISGYNIRLLAIIQSISQLESVYGEKDTRTFVTNHALQILFPPREQKDANEYSAILGYFTEKAVSTGTSRPNAWGSNNASNSENVSDQRRALMLPQELKELDQAKEILILENTKPILCDKSRYYNDHTFVDRLKSVSPSLAALGKKLPTEDQIKDAAFTRNEMSSEVPKIDISLHKAKMEHRTRYLAPGELIDLAKLALNLDELPAMDNQETPSDEAVDDLVGAFFSQVEWMDIDTGEIGEAPTDAGFFDIGGDKKSEATAKMGGGEIEPVFPASDLPDEGHNYLEEAGDAVQTETEPPAPRRQTKRKTGVIDLAVLDN